MTVSTEWTEESAAEALENPQREMVAGLKAQANGQTVMVESEFATLRGAILGNPESVYIPDPFHPSWYASMRSLPKDELAWMAAHRGMHIRDADPKLWEAMSEGLSTYRDILESRGVCVIQNTQSPPEAVVNYTGGWLGKFGRHWAYHAQAFGEVFGNLLVSIRETQPSIRYNGVEYLEAFMGLFESDPKAVWLTMPDPLPLPAFVGVGLSPGDIRILPGKRVLVGLGVFNRADIGNLAIPRSSGNELGVEVLRRMLAPWGWSVEVVYFDANYGYHIDTLMPLISEGLLAVHPEVLLTPLPYDLASWEQIPLSTAECRAGAGNSVPLSPTTHMVTKSATQFMSDLDARGIEPIPVPFEEVYAFCGSGVRGATFSFHRSD